MSEDTNRFSVLVLRFDAPVDVVEERAASLGAILRIGYDDAKRALANAPTVIRRDVDEADARRLLEELRDAGIGARLIGGSKTRTTGDHGAPRTSGSYVIAPRDAGENAAIRRPARRSSPQTAADAGAPEPNRLPSATVGEGADGRDPAAAPTTTPVAPAAPVMPVLPEPTPRTPPASPGLAIRDPEADLGALGADAWDLPSDLGELASGGATDGSAEPRLKATPDARADGTLFGVPSGGSLADDVVDGLGDSDLTAAAEARFDDALDWAASAPSTGVRGLPDLPPTLSPVPPSARRLESSTPRELSSRPGGDPASETSSRSPLPGDGVLLGPAAPARRATVSDELAAIDDGPGVSAPGGPSLFGPSPSHALTPTPLPSPRDGVAPGEPRADDPDALPVPDAPAPIAAGATIAEPMRPRAPAGVARRERPTDTVPPPPKNDEGSIDDFFSSYGEAPSGRGDDADKWSRASERSSIRRPTIPMDAVVGGAAIPGIAHSSIEEELAEVSGLHLIGAVERGESPRRPTTGTHGAVRSTARMAAVPPKPPTWKERVPWPWVGGATVVVLALVALVVGLRMQTPQASPQWRIANADVYWEQRLREGERSVMGCAFLDGESVCRYGAGWFEGRIPGADETLGEHLERTCFGRWEATARTLREEVSCALPARGDTGPLAWHWERAMVCDDAPSELREGATTSCRVRAVSVARDAAGAEAFRLEDDATFVWRLDAVREAARTTVGIRSAREFLVTSDERRARRVLWGDDGILRQHTVGLPTRGTPVEGEWHADAERAWQRGPDGHAGQPVLEQPPLALVAPTPGATVEGSGP